MTVWEAVAVLERAGVTTGPQFEELRRRTRAAQVVQAEPEHGVADVRKFAAVCICGHTTRSTVPGGARLYLEVHVDEIATKEERSDASQ